MATYKLHNPFAKLFVILAVCAVFSTPSPYDEKAELDAQKRRDDEDPGTGTGASLLPYSAVKRRKATVFFNKVKKLANQVLMAQRNESEVQILAQSIMTDLRRGGFCGLKKGNVYGTPLEGT